MPIHSKSRSSEGGEAKKAKKVDMSAASKRGPGGVKKSFRAIRAEAKNGCLVKEVLAICRDAKDYDEMAAEFKAADITLGRVTASPGGRHLVVTLMTCEKNVSVPISGVVSFKGAVRTKGHLPTFMGVDDIVVLFGAYARGKIPHSIVPEVQASFARVKFPVPHHFFPEEHAGGEGWEFDREAQSAWDETMCSAAITVAKDSDSDDSDDIDAI